MGLRRKPAPRDFEEELAAALRSIAWLRAKLSKATSKSQSTGPSDQVAGALADHLRASQPHAEEGRLPPEVGRTLAVLADLVSPNGTWR